MVAQIANLARSRFLVAAVVMLGYASTGHAQVTIAQSLGPTGGFVYTDNGNGASATISANETLTQFFWSPSFVSAHPAIAGSDSSGGGTITETISMAGPNNTTQAINITGISPNQSYQQGFNNTVTMTIRNTTLGKNLLVVAFTNTGTAPGLGGAQGSTVGQVLGDSNAANQTVVFSSDFSGLFTGATDEAFTDALGMSRVLTPDPSGTKAFLSFTATETGSFQLSTTTVPEPSSLLLAGSVALGLGASYRLRRWRRGGSNDQPLPVDSSSSTPC